MAVFKDYITTTGQRMLAQMLTGEVENLKFTKMVLGDGANKNPEGATEVTNPICEVEIESVTLSDNNVLTITASFTNEDITSGFYMREKGLYLSDGEEEILAIYANTGSTAGYVEPAASGLIKKVIRSSVTFSQADIVNVELIDNSYANAVDFEKHEKDKENPHNVTAKQVGLENVPNVQTNDQTPTYEGTETLTELKSGEKLSTAFGKLAKAVKDFISHIANTAIHFTAEEREKLKNIAEGANKYSHPSYTARTGVPAGNQTPGFGGTFTVTQSVSDATGHITGMNSRSVTIPSAVATTSAAGLMSATDKTKLNGIAIGANKTTIYANLTTTAVGCALDATMGKDLYSYVRMLQSDVVYLKYLANTSSADFIEAKYFKNHSSGDLGNINYAYMPYEKMAALTTSNKVIVGFTNGAVGIFSVDVAAGNTLGRTITWIRGSVPYVSKTTIQGGTNTLALATGSGAYTIWDDELYQVSGTVKQTLVFEISAASSDISVFYKII